MNRKVFALTLVFTALFLLCARGAPASEDAAAVTGTAVSQETAADEKNDAAKEPTTNGNTAANQTAEMETSATNGVTETDPASNRLDQGASYYIIGNPDCYPFEYYNNKSKSFEGILPGILKDFAAENNILLFYIKSAETRKELVKNAQGELISACVDDDYSSLKRTEPLFTYQGSDNETHTIRLAFSVSADEDFVAMITKSAARLSDRQKLDYYHSFMVSDKQEFKPAVYYSVFLICLATIAGLAVFTTYQSRKLARSRQFTLGTDYVMTRNETQRHFDYEVKDAVRNMFDIIFIRCRFAEENARRDDRLKEFAQLIRKNLVGDGRLGHLNDGFCIISDGREQEAETLVSAIEQTRLTHLLDENLADLQVNYGIYRLGKSDRSFFDAADKAILAADYAAENGYVSVNFDQNTEQFQSKSIFSEEDIRSGLQKGEFHPVYQPLFSAATGKIAFFEAFGRWDSQKYGYLKEQSFREFCRRKGLVAELDLQVFSEVCRRQAFRTKLGKPSVPIICNFSRRSLLSRHFIVNILTTLKKTGCEASDFIFELRMKDRTISAATLAETTNRLREIGIAVCLDVADTGVVLFEDFSQIKADYLKIDKSILKLVGNNDGTVILLNLFSALRSMNIKLIVNSITDADLLEKAIKIRSDYLQGDYCCEQTDAAGAEKLLDSDFEGRKLS